MEQQFGPEWEKEVMKWKKVNLVGWIRELLQEQRSTAVHKVKRKTGIHGDTPVTWSQCKCGWKTSKLNSFWEYLDSHLKDEEYRHLVECGIIKRHSL